MARINLFSTYLLVTVLASMACAAPVHAATTNEEAVGVIAPDDDDTNNTAPAPAGNMSTPQVLQYTPTLGQPGIINDLGMASAVYGGDKKLITPPMDFSKATHTTINGKPAVEFMVEAHIARAMHDLKDPSLTRAERNAKGHAAYEYLSNMTDTLRQKQMLPDKIYKNIGVTDTYIKDERDANDAALVHLDAALEDLKSYQ
jgi:hypothetical protein